MTTTRLTIARLNALTHPDRITMGAAAAEQAAHEMIEVIAKKGAARIIFACAPSQDEFLASLTSAPGINWSRVTIFSPLIPATILRLHPGSTLRLDSQSARFLAGLR
jgi:glucosamine-6-phosphate deaminase